MKKMFLVGIALFAVQSSALACPNLTGEYIGNGYDHITIKHEGNVLQINNDPGLIINNESHEIILGEGVKFVYTGTCPSDTQIVLHITGTIPGEPTLDITQTMTVNETGFHLSMTGSEKLEVDYLKVK